MRRVVGIVRWLLARVQCVREGHAPRVIAESVIGRVAGYRHLLCARCGTTWIECPGTAG